MTKTMDSQGEFRSRQNRNPNYVREAIEFFSLKNSKLTRSWPLDWRGYFEQELKWDLPSSLSLVLSLSLSPSLVRFGRSCICFFFANLVSLNFLQVGKMEGFSQNLYFCSQPNVMGTEIFLPLNSYGTFQPYAIQVEGRVEERVVCGQEGVVRGQEGIVCEEEDCEIVGSSKKRAASKQNPKPKKKAAKSGES